MIHRYSLFRKYGWFESGIEALQGCPSLLHWFFLPQGFLPWSLISACHHNIRSAVFLHSHLRWTILHGWWHLHKVPFRLAGCLPSQGKSWIFLWQTEPQVYSQVQGDIRFMDRNRNLCDLCSHHNRHRDKSTFWKYDIRFCFSDHRQCIKDTFHHRNGSEKFFHEISSQFPARNAFVRDMWELICDDFLFNSVFRTDICDVPSLFSKWGINAVLTVTWPAEPPPVNKMRLLICTNS